MESGIITDNQLTSSSNQGPEYGAQYSRLNLRLGAGAWCAASCDSSEFLQIDLGQVYLVTNIEMGIESEIVFLGLPDRIKGVTRFHVVFLSQFL